MTQLDEPRGAVVRFNMLDAAVAIVILLLIPLAYAAYLLVVQLAVIDAVCTWCVASDVVLVLLATFTVARLRQSSS